MIGSLATSVVSVESRGNLEQLRQKRHPEDTLQAGRSCEGQVRRFGSLQTGVLELPSHVCSSSVSR